MKVRIMLHKYFVPPAKRKKMSCAGQTTFKNVIFHAQKSKIRSTFQEGLSDPESAKLLT